jgi:transposase-like protein
MAEEKPSLHIDTDWKRQAQEEKKRLVEEESKKAAAAPAAALTAPGAAPAPGARPGARPRGELPPANFATLVQSMLTQILFYLGDLTTRGSEPTVNLDLAKHQIDILGILEEKTRNNVTPEEKQLLDTALYESRMRYVSVASQYT